MRQPQKNNRARNKSGRKSNGASVNRVYESNGPEGKVRGTPQQIIEKYQTLARDKATAGDRILAESFLQHAEHYARILTAAQANYAPSPRREEEPEEEAETESAREKSAGGMAVIDSEAEAQPDGLNAERRGGQPGAKQAEGGDDAEHASRRGRRRVSRKPKSEEPAPQEAAAPSGFEVVEPSEPAAAPVGDDDTVWTEADVAPVSSAVN